MILLEKRSHLFLKIPLAVMRLLSFDVLNQRTGIRRAHGKRPISPLPREPIHTLRLHPLGRAGLQLLQQLRQALRRMQPHGQMNMVGYAANPEAIALFIAHNGRQIRMQRQSHTLVQQRPAILRAKHNVNQHKTQRLGHKANYKSGLQPSHVVCPLAWDFTPGWYQTAPPALFVCVMLAVSFLLLGCNTTPVHTTSTITTSQYPPRPTTLPPPFKLFHQTPDGSFTLVTTPTATDAQIEAIVWQLRDAAHTRTFDKLGIPQKIVDARDPMVWFHIYRGPKCADEKYTDGKLPCGDHYNASGDYSFGGGANHQWDDGVLLHHTATGPNQQIQDQQTELWNPNAK
jgi:hypothetical protein